MYFGQVWFGSSARGELLREDTPADLADFDAWVIRTVLNSQTPLFREARYLLAEETEIRDPSLRDLLAVKGFDTRDSVLTCYSGAGFDRELQAGQRHDIHLIGLDQLYAD